MEQNWRKWLNIIMDKAENKKDSVWQEGRVRKIGRNLI